MCIQHIAVLTCVCVSSGHLEVLVPLIEVPRTTRIAIPVGAMVTTTTATPGTRVGGIPRARASPTMLTVRSSAPAAIRRGPITVTPRGSMLPGTPPRGRRLGAIPRRETVDGRGAGTSSATPSAMLAAAGGCSDHGKLISLLGLGLSLPESPASRCSGEGVPHGGSQEGLATRPGPGHDVLGLLRILIGLLLCALGMCVLLGRHTLTPQLTANEGSEDLLVLGQDLRILGPPLGLRAVLLHDLDALSQVVLEPLIAAQLVLVPPFGSLSTSPLDTLIGATVIASRTWPGEAVVPEAVLVIILLCGSGTTESGSTATFLTVLSVALQHLLHLLACGVTSISHKLGHLVQLGLELLTTSSVEPHALHDVLQLWNLADLECRDHPHVGGAEKANLPPDSVDDLEVSDRVGLHISSRSDIFRGLLEHGQERHLLLTVEASRLSLENLLLEGVCGVTCHQRGMARGQNRRNEVMRADTHTAHT